MSASRLLGDFFRRDALVVAPALLGCRLVRRLDNGNILSACITEVEAYCGADDLACHASKGRTKRTEVMFHNGGLVYVYLIYGMYWMLNIVTGSNDSPQAVLIRGIEGIDGPGRVARYLSIDKSFYGEDLTTSHRLWIEPGEVEPASVDYITTPRIGVNYAGDWVHKHWRFVLLGKQ